MPLDNRLACIAQMVQPCTLVADIGTDHGFLVCELVKNGKCNKGIAADINPKPLAKAKSEILCQGLEEQIETRLTDGLVGIGGQVDAVVLAGMGGELIASIIDRWPHSRSTHRRFYLQPMTKADYLREWLWSRGFDICKEECCQAAGKAYSVMEVVYIGQKIDYAPVDLWLGRVDLVQDSEAHAYSQRVLHRLERQARGMAAGQHDPQQLAALVALCNDIKERIKG